LAECFGKEAQQEYCNLILVAGKLQESGDNEERDELKSSTESLTSIISTAKLLAGVCLTKTESGEIY